MRSSKPNTAARPAGAFFCWEVPDEAAAVHFHLSTVQLLERDAIRAGDKSAAGVLLGRTEPGRPLTLIIESFEAATPENGASESPFKDRQLVESITDRWRPGQRRMTIVGFYRTCGREGAALNKDDLAALGTSVVPTNTNAHDVKNLNREHVKRSLKYSEPRCAARPPAPCQLRPFFASLCHNRDLRLRSNLGPGADSIDTSRQGSTLSASGPALAIGAHLTGSERVFLLIEPRAGRGGNASFYLARDGAVLCQSPRMPFNRAELSNKEIVRQSPGSGIRDLSFGTEDNQALHRERKFRVPIDKDPATLRSWRWLLATVAAIAIVSVGFFQVRGQQRLHALPIAEEAPADSRLGLKLQRRGSDWELTWNKASPILLQAEKARLRITDSFIHKNIELDPSELRNGRIIYAPVSDDVVVQLEIERAKPAEQVSESVRVVEGLLPLSGSQGYTADASREVRNELRRLARLSNPSAPNAARRSDKGFTVASPSSASLVSAEPADSQTSVETGTSNDFSQPETKDKPEDQLLTVSVPPESGPIPALSGTELLSTLVPPPVRQGGEAEPAKLISRQDPVYPPEARRRHISGAVEVHFKVAANGEVRDVTATKGAAVLVEAAVDAVRKWRYKPARLNGVPTEVPAMTLVNFRLDGFVNE